MQTLARVSVAVVLVFGCAHSAAPSASEPAVRRVAASDPAPHAAPPAPPASPASASATPPEHPLSAGTTASSTAQFMSSVPLTLSPAALAALRASLAMQAGAGELDLELSVALPDRAEFSLIAARLPGARVKASRLRLPLRLPEEKPKRSDVRRWSAPSFVIDYDAPGFQPFTQAFAPKLGAQPEPHDVEHFVAAYITKKTFSRGFAIASEVASTRAGDCTEHAVLLAAALRSQHIPARVVFGIVIVVGERAAAFGHAWVEAVQHGAFVRLDAALLDVPEKQGVLLHYIPLTALVDEGLGFSRTLREQPDTIHVREVAVLLASEAQP